jgi:hypothetical protein
MTATTTTVRKATSLAHAKAIIEKFKEEGIDTRGYEQYIYIYKTEPYFGVYLGFFNSFPHLMVVEKGFTVLEDVPQPQLITEAPTKNKEVLNYKYRKGVTDVFPAHWMVANWTFTSDTEEEATLANAMAAVAEKSGMDANDLSHLFPAVLRMLKNNSAWSK